jgi:hypothetical protein
MHKPGLSTTAGTRAALISPVPEIFGHRPHHLTRQALSSEICQGLGIWVGIPLVILKVLEFGALGELARPLGLSAAAVEWVRHGQCRDRPMRTSALFVSRLHASWKMVGNFRMSIGVKVTRKSLSILIVRNSEGSPFRFSKIREI